MNFLGKLKEYSFNFQKALGIVTADEKYIKGDCIVYILSKNKMFHTPDALNQLATTYLESLQHIKIDQLKITDKQGNQYLPDTVKNLYLKYKLISLKFDIIPKNEISFCLGIV